MTMTEVLRRRRSRIRPLADVGVQLDPLSSFRHVYLVPLENVVESNRNERGFIPGEDVGRNERQGTFTQAPTSVATTNVDTDQSTQGDWSQSNNVDSYSDYFGSYVSSSWGGWGYFFFLYWLLFLWVLYLVFPKGCRRRLCGALPRRYARTKWKNEFGSWVNTKGITTTKINDSFTPMGGASTNMGATYYTYSSSTQDSSIMEVEEQRRRERQIFLQELQDAREEGRNQLKEYQNQQLTTRQQAAVPDQESQSVSAQAARNWVTRAEKDAVSSLTGEASGHDKYDTHVSTAIHQGPVISPTRGEIRLTAPVSGGSGGTPNTSGFMFGTPHATSAKKPPSPEHPGIARLPSPKILNETMDRLRKRGIRLIAHGVQCEPKRVWIRLDEETTSVTWQTEYPRRITNQSGEASIVLMRGALHRIALPNVLYIDIGKKTNALMRRENKSIPDSTCFSLLTQNGSLDLQTNSKLERDALVSCFSLVLDQVHTEDWRNLYEESPAPSQTQSSSNNDTGSIGGTIPSDMVEI